jgi:tetratricopeptide (TPR) repeat protein
MKTMNAIIILVLLILVGCEGAGPGSNEVPITTSNDEALQFYLDGRDLSEKVKGPQAAELYDKAIASDPDFAMAYLSRAFSGGGYDVYRKNFAKAVELIDKVSPGEKHLILYYQAGADNDDAKQTAELDTLLNMYPEDKRIQTLAGNYYRFEQNNEKALGHFNRAVELDPDYAFGYNLLGYMHIAMGNFEEAEAAFKKYISLTPDEANPYDSYAEFLLNQGRFEESLDQYKKALEVDPEFNFAYYGIGNSYD